MCGTYQNPKRNIELYIVNLLGIYWLQMIVDILLYFVMIAVLVFMT